MSDVLAKTRNQIVLLGASNLTRGISTVVSWLNANGMAPYDLYLAFGFGRSFGIRSRVFGRDLPGIQESELWGALAGRPADEQAAPHYALITDIGNDVFYQVPVETIVAWLRDALERLRALRARVILVQIPLDNVAKVSDLQFFILSKVLFPGRGLQKAVVAADVVRLGGAIAALAREFDATLVTQNASWYGFDPIHYRVKFWRTAWAQVLGAWLGGGAIAGWAGWGQWRALRTLRPHVRWLFGREQRKEQPAGRLGDGSRVFVY